MRANSKTRDDPFVNRGPDRAPSTPPRRALAHTIGMHQEDVHLPDPNSRIAVSARFKAYALFYDSTHAEV
jgi:hypothetical protein